MTSDNERDERPGTAPAGESGVPGEGGARKRRRRGRGRGGKPEGQATEGQTPERQATEGQTPDAPQTDRPEPGNEKFPEDARRNRSQRQPGSGTRPDPGNQRGPARQAPRQPRDPNQRDPNRSATPRPPRDQNRSGPPRDPNLKDPQRPAGDSRRPDGGRPPRDPNVVTPGPAAELQGEGRSRRRRGRRGGGAVPASPHHGETSAHADLAAGATRRPQRENDESIRPERPRIPNRRTQRGEGAVASHTGTIAEGPKGALRVIPLGGVLEVGKNMTVVEYERDLLLLDCGGKFPTEEQRGIDLIIPDITYIKQRIHSLRAILITHGHEDHIGGLPYVVDQIKGSEPIPIYGSPLAIGFIERKLMEHRLDKYVDLRVVSSGDKIKFGALTAEFIHVTHSIPDTNAIAVHSPVGTILDTADFKFDPTPVMGAPTDERRLGKLGHAGVLALFSDTVRVETGGSTPSERVVAETIDKEIGQARGQVIIATFASNISRIHMAIMAAEKHGRKVAVAGRSMEQNARVAGELGYIDRDMLASIDEVLKLPREKRVFVITGSQGEAAAALAKIAAAEHPRVRVGKGDTILVSATPIPGNEETVSQTIDNLFRRGANVVYSGIDRGVHVSGHAGRDELRKMIDLIKPKYAVPIHGEYRHMALYRDLCREAGIPGERVLFPEIGGVIEFTEHGVFQRQRVKAGSILVDRIGEQGRGPVKLREPEKLDEEGVVVVTVVFDREKGTLIAGPDIVARGLKPELDASALKAAENELRLTLERRTKGEPLSGFVGQRVKETVGRALLRRSRSRPLILPVVLEI
jgi:ribonuclease J